MASLTIKNVPEVLLRRLRARALLHHRSLNHEVIVCLEAAVQATPVDPDTLLARARAVRRVPGRTRLTDGALARLKGRGRP